ncbi:MAG: aldolase/citrate lyase family protein [Dehalococcoidales bacterium]
MRKNKVKSLWQEGKTPTVAWLDTADTFVAETIANIGFDVLVLDMQHGMAIGPDRAALWLQAVSTTDTMPMVRVPWNEPFFIQWVLDAGAYGVIVPLVNTREEAVKAAGACRYPPIGYRSAGANRARLYGGVDYFKQANKEIICLVMIEDIKTVAHIDTLADVPGIDGFYIGPSDLAVSMGLGPPEYRESAKHAEACNQLLETAKSRGLICGIHCGSPGEVVQRTSQGFVFCPAISGIGSLAVAASAALEQVRGRKI